MFWFIITEQDPAIQTVCVDLCDIEAALQKIECLGDIHLLVNNAGITILSAFEEAKPNDFDKYVPDMLIPRY